MLPARTIPFKRFAFRLKSRTWTRHNLTPPTNLSEKIVLKQEDLNQNPSAAEGGLPPSAQRPASSNPQEIPLPESTKASSSPSYPNSDSASEKPDSSKALSQYDLEVVKLRIRDWTEQAAITLRERTDGFTAHTKSRFFQLGAELNKVTGYLEIEALKKQVVEQEEKIKITREAAKQAKRAHEQAVIQRSNSQREINDLLQRKSLWNEQDVIRFTTIVRQDHLFEQEEARAKAAVDETEAAVEREFTSLMKSILARYHEEQVWSDKIRSASTYGSLAVLGLNLVVFILAIVIVEPWKRRRLAQTFEKKIEGMNAENKSRMEESLKEIGEKFVQRDGLLGQLLESVSELKQRTTENKALRPPMQAVETPIPAQKSVSFPGIPVSLPQRTFELAAVGVGAFVLGILASVLLDD